MGSPVQTLRRRVPLHALVSCVCVLLASARAGADPAADSSRLEARTLARHEWKSRIRWIGATRIGLLHVVASDSFYTFDLLDGGKELPPVPLSARWETPQPLPIPGSHVVLVPRAPSGLLAGVSAPVRSTPDRAQDTLSSYGIDAFSGRVLWEQPPLAGQTAFEYVPDAGVLLATQPNARLMEGIDLASGKVLWRVEAEGWGIRVRGAYADVLGDEARLLDLRTGEVVAHYRLPGARKGQVAFLSSSDRLVVRAKKAILGYDLPPLPVSGGSGIPAASRDTVIAPAWTWETRAAAGFREFTPLSGDRVLVRSWSGVHLLDAATGRSLWSDPEPNARILPSPGLTRAVAWAASRITLFDLVTGSTEVRRVPLPCRDLGGKVRSIDWLDDDHLLLCCAREKGAMTGMSVFSRREKRELWKSGAIFPEVQYAPLTEEKVATTLKNAAVITSVAGAMVVGPAAYANFVTHMTPFGGLATTASPLGGVATGLSTAGKWLAVGGLLTDVATRAGLKPHDQITRYPFLDAGVGLAPSARGPAPADSPSAVAWRRYARHWDLLQALRPGARTSVGGENDAYRVVEQDFLVPTQRTIAGFHRKNVNGMGLLTPYPLAVSVEDDEHSVRVLWLERADPSPALPELLPPSSDGRR